MNLVKNKSGLGLPTALGISFFIIALVSSLLAYAVFQARLINKSIESTEAYANASQALHATLNIIANEQDLDPSFLDPLAQYMNVSITQHSPNVWLVTAMIPNSDKVLVSYFSLLSTHRSTYDLVFSQTGQDPSFVFDPFITPSSLLSAYLPIFIQNNFPAAPSRDLTDFNSIFNYIRSLTNVSPGYLLQQPSSLTNQTNPTVTGHWFIDGSVTIPNNLSLTIPQQFILFIDGNLTMNRNSTLSGNIVVNGDVIINGTSSSIQHLNGTLYLSGSFSTTRNIVLGPVSRPSFILAEGNISIGRSMSGYGYLLTSSDFVDLNENFAIFGGIYAKGNLGVRTGSQVFSNTNLTALTLVNFMIPQAISTQGAGENIIFTPPKIR